MPSFFDILPPSVRRASGIITGRTFRIIKNSIVLQVLNGDLYEIPDGKPAGPPKPTNGTTVPEWLKKVEALHGGGRPQRPSDENSKPQPAVYIENVLLPTRATKVFYFLQSEA